ncbi:hypothetical protein LR48_Vigan04g169800 [Vigna angularis]|uniref:Uncharacterized protein n=1 Tax=Phaseolus angularis TaxID=3914 RepID=A0A0L9UF41_PHAAN|nr:hypothetical protein LR48_Vigan04g169800 [Vigna angularis]
MVGGTAVRAQRGELSALLLRAKKGRRGKVGAVVGGDSGDDRCRWRQFWPVNGMCSDVGLMEGRASTIGSEEETLNFVPREKKEETLVSNLKELWAYTPKPFIL